jgi:hypothetical protein
METFPLLQRAYPSQIHALRARPLPRRTLLYTIESSLTDEEEPTKGKEGGNSQGYCLFRL